MGARLEVRGQRPQEGSGGTISNWGMVGSVLVLFSSKSLFQSHYCHIIQWTFKFLGSANFSRWGWENIMKGCKIFLGYVCPPENPSMDKRFNSTNEILYLYSCTLLQAKTIPLSLLFNSDTRLLNINTWIIAPERAISRCH